MRFDENAQRISVNGRPKRIKMYAFLNENALGWTGPIRSSSSSSKFARYEKSGKVNLTSGLSLHFSLTALHQLIGYRMPRHFGDSREKNQNLS